jgi:hypothetical protein
MGFLDSLFGSKVKVPEAVTVNPTEASQEAANYNISQIDSFKGYSKDLSSFMKSLFDDLVPNVGKAQETNYNLGNQLATTGQTTAMGDFSKYARRLGLETAAATGSPVNSMFSQNLGGSIAMQNILSNQMQGVNLLNNYSTFQTGLANNFMQPSLSILNANLSSPGQFISARQSNANATNQMNLTAANAAAQPSPFGSFLTNMVSSVGGTAAGIATGNWMGGMSDMGNIQRAINPSTNLPFGGGMATSFFR